MTDNKKLLKEFANIYASCNKAKQGAIAEIGKIDEKYRKLAEEEKKQLNELVKAIDSQMEMYGNYLGLNKAKELVGATHEDTEISDAVEEPVENEKVVDTIFPENNEEKPEESEGKDEQSVSKQGFDSDIDKQTLSDVFEEAQENMKAEAAMEWPEDKKEVELEEPAGDEWPAFPDKW